MDFTQLIKMRRSTRAFMEKQITDEELNAVLAAAQAAPTGSALYKDIHLTVLRDRDVMHVLAEASADRTEDKAEMDRVFARSRRLTPTGGTSGNGVAKRYDPFYGAPVAIIVSHRVQDAQPGIEFSNAAIIAYQMHLAATGLGLGSVLLWFVIETMRWKPELKLESHLRLPEGFAPVIGVCLGHTEAKIEEREINTDRYPVDYI